MLTPDQSFQEWSDSSRFWCDVGPYFFSSHRWDSAEEDVECIVNLLGLKDGSTILDLACGPGIHLIELGKRGFEVTGVDLAASCLDEARRRLELEEAQVELIQADMREFQRPHGFDAAINLGTSFGYFENILDDQRVAANLFSSVRPGGKVLIDLIGKEVLARYFTPRSWALWDDGTYTLEHLYIDPRWEWLETHWTVLRGSQSSDYGFRCRLYSATELSALLESVGFARVQIYGGLDGRAYNGHAASRLVMVAEHP